MAASKKFIAIATAFMLSTSVAFGHASLVQSIPASGAVVPPGALAPQLEFSEPIEMKFSSFKLFDSSGNEISMGESKPTTPDGKTITLTFPTLAAGGHVLRWSVVAKDGHRSKGDVKFDVR